jgi:hypothetical protein
MDKKNAGKEYKEKEKPEMWNEMGQCWYKTCKGNESDDNRKSVSCYLM